MTRQRLLTIAVVGLLVLNFATLAFLFLGHRPMRGGPGGPPPPRLDRMIVHELKLNDAQQKQFELLRDDHHRKTMELDERDRKLRDALLDLQKTDSTNASRVDSLIRQMGRIRVDREHLNYDHFHQLRLLCNPEQKRRFDDLMNEISDVINHQGPPR